MNGDLMSNPLYGFSAASKPAMPPSQKLWVVVFALFVGGLAAFAANHYLTRGSTPAAPAASKTAVEVQSRLLGVWTFAKPVNLDRAPYGWERWNFTKDGVEIQSARPSELAWGKPTRYGYEIERRKTGDSGEWYWHVTVKETVMNAGWKDGTLTAFWAGTADSNYRLVKEDKDLSK